jgi:flagellar basal-body rod protein FlgB
MLDGIDTRLERYMDLLSARQRLVAGNIANANTPGYRTKDIDFQREYASLVEGTSPQVVEPEDLKGRNDGNNVSIDRESRLLAENAIRFGAATHLLRARLRQVRSAIKEGGA